MELIVNASPLIASAKAGLLELWLEYFPDFYIPSAVREEVCAFSDPEDPAKKWLQSAQARSHDLASPSVDPFVLAYDLGSGESSVISSCLSRPGALAVLDDLAARRCASALNIPVIGTLGLLLKLSQIHPTIDVRYYLKRLESSGLYLPKKLLQSWLGEADN